MPYKRVFLALGSNIGEREVNLESAISALAREQITVLARSSLYETEPQDVLDQPWFLNMVIECETRCFPLQLLAIAQRIEREFGRVRANSPRRGPRTLDIDLLLYGETIMSTPQLSVPHPRLLQRRFVLEPLLEIAPELRHPETKEPLRKALVKLKNQKVLKIAAGGANCPDARRLPF